jgi:hypothetical protein
LALKDENDKEPLYIADCYCHLDILFEKQVWKSCSFKNNLILTIFRMNNPKQTIWQYLQHNKGLYNKGIDMIYVVQTYFGPHHIKQGKLDLFCDYKLRVIFRKLE